MLEKKIVNITPLGLDRCLHIYLPDGYYQSQKQYPVLYMFDGHNLFLDEDATFGYAWHIHEQFSKQHIEMIVVGLECNHEGNERLNEFCPYPVNNERLGNLDGRGEILMQWMTSDLIDFVERKYRTNDKRYLAGSSMGGLMALYGIIKYPSIYLGAACLSSSIFVCYDELLNEIRQSVSMNGARIYMSYGSEETRSKKGLAYVVKNHCILASKLEKKGAKVFFDMIVDGKHSESTWQNQVLDFVAYLGDEQ